jgi:hypothetical protein
VSDDVPAFVSTPQDALLMCDYMARFGYGDTQKNFAGISAVIRDLMRRLEEQAMRAEHAEAAKGGAA